MNKIQLCRNTNLIEKIVLVDGLTRTGKSMIGPILASLENVEIERVEAIFEYIPFLDSIGKLDRDAAVVLLKLEADTKLYESMIGRNTNFRKTDHSSVFNNPFKFDYIKRLFRKEGQSVVKDISRNKTIFQVQTHDTLGMIDPFFDAFDDSVFVIQMIRDPVDLIYSWYNRGWGERFVTDPLALTFSIKTKNGVAPWYNLFIDGEYNNLIPMDKIIYMIDALQRRSLKKYYDLDRNRKKQVLWIIFEDFVTMPFNVLSNIELFLGTCRTRHTIKTMRKQRCPRKLSKKIRDEKKQIIKDKASPEAFQKIDQLYEWYNTVRGIAKA
jgi:hypothetical protein